MSAHYPIFPEYSHVSHIRDYARGFFDALSGKDDVVVFDDAHEFAKGATFAHGLMKQWAGARSGDAATLYRNELSRFARDDSHTEGRVARSLSIALQGCLRRLAGLQLELDHHQNRTHPTKRALRSLIFRCRAETRSVEKDIESRRRSPSPCVGCPAAVLCRDLGLACNAYHRFAALSDGWQTKLNDIPRSERKPTEATTTCKMPPSKYWFQLTYGAGA